MFPCDLCPESALNHTHVQYSGDWCHGVMVSVPGPGFCERELLPVLARPEWQYRSKCKCSTLSSRTCRFTPFPTRPPPGPSRSPDRG